MLNKNSFLFLCPLMILFLHACGFKGDLYLPTKQENDSNFGVIQTGVGVKPPQENTTQPKDSIQKNQENQENQ